MAAEKELRRAIALESNHVEARHNLKALLQNLRGASGRLSLGVGYSLDTSACRAPIPAPASRPPPMCASP